MGTVRKTITVTDQQDNWIKAQIEAGHYTNDSEYPAAFKQRMLTAHG
jgi:antitoxin ParD1/3/4